MVTYPKSNVGRMHSVGSDGNIEFFHTINKDMSFTVRANYTFSQNIIDYFEENKLPYDYLSVTGRPFNILRGYISEGLFASKDEINTSPDQTDSERYARATSNIAMSTAMVLSMKTIRCHCLIPTSYQE